jgi:hypothetical protein
MRTPRSASAAILCLALASASAQQVTSSGVGSAAVDTMSGGAIHIGVTPAQLEAVIEARGDQQLRLLREISAKLNNALGKVGTEEFSATIAHGFLAPQGRIRPSEVGPPASLVGLLHLLPSVYATAFALLDSL